MYGVCRKLRALQKPLLEFNKKYFAGVDERELELSQKLEKVQAELNLNPQDIQLQIEEKEILRQYYKIKADALSFLRQKAKLQWLREGDENTKIFHNSIKQRQYINRISRINNDHRFPVTG
ncbi:hypothetical protein RIF29_19223 [Crotalaria pallida]|uniref:Uncharacterized protein n=1 Tax=Crotalaria pallida TaxID=3830 RepID=A0AAN9I6B2_CROPI